MPLIRALVALACGQVLACVNGMRVAFEQTGGYIINAEPMRADVESIVQIKAECTDHLDEDESTRMIWAIYHQDFEDRVGHILAEAGYLCHNHVIVHESAIQEISTGNFTCAMGQLNEKHKNINKDGFWLAEIVSCSSSTHGYRGVVVHEGRYGYLSADQFPLLVFHGLLSIMYTMVASVWLLAAFRNWRDIYKLQYWISAVLLVSMMEAAMFYGWYEYSNYHGYASKPLLGASVFLMVVKLTVARMIVLMACMGYGVVKPSLGPEMRRIIFLGVIYFVAALIYWEAVYMQHAHNLGLSASEEDTLIVVEKVMVFAVSFLDAVIVFWIMQSLYMTMAQLKIRNQAAKHEMYRKFFWILIGLVVMVTMSMVVMALIARPGARKNFWQWRWFEAVSWKLIFLYILVAIMVLWRPSPSSKRFAYTPLDRLDDEEETVTIANMHQDTVRARHASPARSLSLDDSTDLAWVEENITTNAGDTRPMLFDGEDERRWQRLEMSKMQ